MPLSFNGRTSGFEPGDDGSEPSDGATPRGALMVFLFLPPGSEAENIGLSFIWRGEIGTVIS